MSRSPPPKKPAKFARDFSSARLPDGKTVTFTAAEAKVISVLAARPGHAMSRATILDAMAADGEKSERSVDFLINRIRKKLDDRARAPVHIETRYGGGYLWKVQTPFEENIEGAFALLGPIINPPAGEQARDLLLRFGRDLQAELQRTFSEEDEIIFAPEIDHLDPYRASAPPITVEITCLSQKQEAIEYLVTAHSRSLGRVLTASRHNMQINAAGLRQGSRLAREIATQVSLEDWKGQALRATETVAIPLAAHMASRMPKNAAKAWPITERKLRTLRELDPHNPELKLMYAAHLQSRYAVQGVSLFAEGIDTRHEDERLIEELVFDALDFARGSPNYAITAAKLLYFLDGQYREIAVELAEEAQAVQTIAPASLAIVGQLRAFTGRTEAAVSALRQALAMTRRDTDFRLYVLVIFAQVLTAIGDRGTLKEVLDELYHSVPGGSFLFAPMFPDPETPSLRARAAAMVIGHEGARARLMHAHYVCARLFERREHGYNLLLGPTRLFQRRHEDVVPEELLERFPQLASGR